MVVLVVIIMKSNNNKYYTQKIQFKFQVQTRATLTTLAIW